MGCWASLEWMYKERAWSYGWMCIADMNTAIARTQGLRPPTHMSVRFRGVAKSWGKYCQCVQLYVFVNNCSLGEKTSNCNFLVLGWSKPERPAAKTCHLLLLCCTWLMCWCSVLLRNWHCSNRAHTAWLEYFCIRVCVSVFPKFPHGL